MVGNLHDSNENVIKNVQSTRQKMKKIKGVMGYKGTRIVRL